LNYGTIQIILLTYLNRFFMKLLKTVNTDIVKYCQDQFSFKLPTELTAYHAKKFTVKLQI